MLKGWKAGIANTLNLFTLNEALQQMLKGLRSSQWCSPPPCPLNEALQQMLKGYAE